MINFETLSITELSENTLHQSQGALSLKTQEQTMNYRHPKLNIINLNFKNAALNTLKR